MFLFFDHYSLSWP